MWSRVRWLERRYDVGDEGYGSLESIRDLLDDADGFSNGTSNGTIDPAFRKIQRNCTGFHIWRVENMNVIAVPKDNYGTFYDADSYIVYASAQDGLAATIDTVCREVKGTTETHIHFWLGSNTSPEKSGVAAYKTVELDGYLGGSAIQHRETQGNESPRFKSYFKNGMRVLRAGTNSPLREIVNTNEPQLYRVKGRRTPIMTQMGSIAWTHFNSGDIFLILAENVIFVWIGRAANAVEKLHSVKIVSQLKTETGINQIIFIDDGYEQTLPPNEKAEFQKYLPLDNRHVMPPSAEESDEEFEKSHRNNLRLYRCTDNGGKYRVTEIKTGSLLQSDLDSDDVYIIDHGLNGIWVWVGKRASDKERVEAMRNARGFVKKKKYPNNTNVTRVVESAESLEFKMLFLYWKDRADIKGKIVPIGKRVITKFDAMTMDDRPALAAETQLIDDGSGVTRMWRIRGNGAIEIPKERHGHFFSGDCYIVWYNYKANTMRHIIFYWIGLNSNPQETSCAEQRVQEIDNELDGTSVQARVIQGKEPAQFLQLFKGSMITYRGEGTDYDDSGKNLKHPSNYLLQIYGSTSFTSKAVQVNYKASALNSNFCFVLKKGKHYYIWCGNCSTGDQREMAKHFTGKDFEIVLEGKEPNEFWDILGGRMPYTTTKMLSSDGFQKPARLFQCSNSSGIFKAEEIFNFSQSDLVPEDVMLLDANDNIFIWIGKLSTKEESRLSLDLAKQYVKTDPSGKDLNTPIIIIRQENEPPNFIGFFQPWDNNFWKNYKCFDEVRQELQGGEIVQKTNSNSHSEDHFDKYEKYPISILKGPSEKLPGKVDPLVKEMHLTHDDFVHLFKMSYKEFEILPRWKQQEMKKKVGLF